MTAGQAVKELSLHTFFLVIADCSAGYGKMENNCVKVVVTRSWLRVHAYTDQQAEKKYIGYCHVVSRSICAKQVGFF